MKKFILFIVCMFSAVSVLAACTSNNNNSNSSSSQSANSDEQVSVEPVVPLNPEYSAYYAIVEELTRQYGEGSMVEQADENGNISYMGISGVSVVRIYDFDGDGVYEMYVAFGNASEDAAALSVPQHQRFYGYANGSAYLISDSIPISNGELSVSPFAQFFICDGKVYYHYQNSFKGAIYTVSGGQMTAVLTYDYDPWAQSEIGPSINGQPVTSEEIDEQLASYASKGQNDYICLYPETAADNSLELVLSETAEVISVLKGE